MGIEEASFRYVDSVTDAADLMTWLSNDRGRSILCVDTETTGLHRVKDHVRLCQLGDSRMGWAIRWDRWSGVVHEALGKYDGMIGMHNAPFDRTMLKKEGLEIPWRRIHDTRLMSYAAEPRMSVALKNVAARHVHPAAGHLSSLLSDAMTNNGWDWSTVPFDFGLYWQYGALDPVLTACVYDQVWPILQATGRVSSYEVELAAAAVTTGMEERGARVDTTFAAAKRDEFVAYAQSIREWCQAAHGIIPTSNTGLIRRFQELGVTLTKRTKGGNLSVDKEVLAEVTAEYGGEPGDLARLALQARQVTKLASTYLSHFATEHVDERVYCHINTIGAPKTGRMSISDPALQTLPRASDGNPLAITVRDCFVPSDGCKLVMCDFDQIEYRLVGHFSQDPTLLAILHDLSVDPFTAMAREIYSDPYLAKKDERRQMTKNAAYAKSYAAGADKFSATAGVPLSVGRPFYELFDRTFPGVRNLQDAIVRTAEQRLREEGEAYIVTPFGKRLSVQYRDEAYKLVNYLIQGTAADVFKIKLAQLDQAGLADYAILPVHDEVVFDVPEDMVDDVKREASRVLSEHEMFSVPLPVGADGPFDRWGDKYK